MTPDELHWRHGIFFSRDGRGRVHMRIAAGPRSESPPSEPNGWVRLPERMSPVDLCIPDDEWANIVAFIGGATKSKAISHGSSGRRRRVPQ